MESSQLPFTDPEHKLSGERKWVPRGALRFTASSPACVTVLFHHPPESLCGRPRSPRVAFLTGSGTHWIDKESHFRGQICHCQRMHPRACYSLTSRVPSVRADRTSLGCGTKSQEIFPGRWRTRGGIKNRDRNRANRLRILEKAEGRKWQSARGSCADGPSPLPPSLESGLRLAAAQLCDWIETALG